MKSIISAFFLFSLFIAGCNKDNKNKEVIKIEGFVLTDNLGNRIGIIGSAGNDWKILDWSQLSSMEQSFLNFSDNVDLNNTMVTTLNEPTPYPNPCSDYAQINFHATDSVKVKLAVVNSAGKVLITHSLKIKGNKSLAIDFSNMSTFPSGMNLRYYFSYSAASQLNFKAGYGDVKICKPLVSPVTSCF